MGYLTDLVQLPSSTSHTHTVEQHSRLVAMGRPRPEGGSRLTRLESTRCQDEPSGVAVLWRLGSIDALSTALSGQ